MVRRRDRPESRARAQRRRPPIRRSAAGSEARRARKRDRLWCPEVCAGKHQRPLALRGDATSTPMRPLGAHLEANPRNARTEYTARAPGARPALPNFSQWRATQCAPEAGSGYLARGTEVGWELHSKEHTSKRNLEMPYAFKVSMIH